MQIFSLYLHNFFSHFVYTIIYLLFCVLFFVQAKLIRCLKELYTELASREPIVPIWAQPVAPGVLCPAHIELELRLHYKSHGLNELLSVDQLLQPLQVCVPTNFYYIILSFTYLHTHTYTHKHTQQFSKHKYCFFN